MKRLSKQLEESYNGPKIPYEEPPDDYEGDYDDWWDKRNYDSLKAERDLKKDLKKLKPIIAKAIKEEFKKFGMGVKRSVVKPVELEIRKIAKQFKVPDWKDEIEECVYEVIYEEGIDGIDFGTLKVGDDKFGIRIELDS